jgi:hypothetical protein
MQLDRVAPGITAEEPRCAGVGAEHSEQDTDRRRLPRSVRAQEAVNFAGAHVEVELVEGAERSERLDESFDLDREFGVTWRCGRWAR